MESVGPLMATGCQDSALGRGSRERAPDDKLDSATSGNKGPAEARIALTRVPVRSE